MYLLQVVSRNDLDVETSFFKTKPEAYAKMVEGVLFTAGCKTVEDFCNRTKKDRYHGDNIEEWLDDDTACCDSRYGDVVWKIVPVPEEV